MSTEQERADFEAWAVSKWPGVSFAPDQNNCGIVVPERYKHSKLQAAWEAYQAGRAALQSQDREADAWLAGMEERVRLFGKAHADKEPFSVRLEHFHQVMSHARRRIEGNKDD